MKARSSTRLAKSSSHLCFRVFALRLRFVFKYPVPHQSKIHNSAIALEQQNANKHLVNVFLFGFAAITTVLSPPPCSCCWLMRVAILFRITLLSCETVGSGVVSLLRFSYCRCPTTKVIIIIIIRATFSFIYPPRNVS